MSRLSHGGLIDRSRPVTFTFDGKSYRGFEGDTLASALVANDVRIVGRSFKYHRPRGLLTAGAEEPNGLVTLRTGAEAEPNTRATMVQLYDGLIAVSQNRWPCLAYDVMAINQLFARMLVAGFYYKTFKWPASFWEKVYEPLIRRAAGLGRLSGEPDPSSYEYNHAFCDLLVIGGGPAGLAAALVAGRARLRVIIVEMDALFGGRLLAERHSINDVDGAQWVREATAELVSLPNVTPLTRTTVFGVYDGREYAAVERLTDHLAVAPDGLPRQRLWKIVARHAVLACGAIERPLVFGGNDRPGVMMASAASTYVNRFAAVPGRRPIIFTCTDSGWRCAEDLVRAGVSVAAVVDPRPSPAKPSPLLRQSGADLLHEAVVQCVKGRQVRGVTVRLAGGGRRTIETDNLLISGGWNPSIGIASNLGGRPIWCDQINSFVINNAPAGMLAAGSAAGRFSLTDALSDGAAAAIRVVEERGQRPPAMPKWKASDEATSMTPLWLIPEHRAKAFVDFQNDVTDADIALAVREGFVSVEHLKRYTTLGMATDQGKTSQVNGHALLADVTGKSIAETGTILSRPPYFPVAVAAFAGRHCEAEYRPERRTAAHEWALEHGAVFVEAGLWRRPRWFALSEDRDWTDSVNREVMAVRSRVGVCDVSTLGKIEIQGADAGAFLDRLYINMFSTLPAGRARYGVMLREDGIVLDDGTATRFSEERYYITTTTANATRVMHHVDFARQVLWPELDIQVTSVSEQWSSYAVAGPSARAVLQKLLPASELSNAALPFMGAIEFRWQDAPAHLIRVSFSGELAYEISVPATHGEQLVRALFDVGAEHGITPYGSEAATVMRIEKGHAAGNELNGQVTAADLGLGHLMSKKKEFIGRVLASRPGLVDPERQRMVGIKPVHRASELRAGGHLLPIGTPDEAAYDQGYVTSSAFSPTLHHWIGLALVKRGPTRYGEHLRLHDPLRGIDVEVELCSSIFVDPEGVRARG